MPNTMRRVLKADEVAYEEPLELSLDKGMPSRRPPVPSAPAPQVNFVENGPQYAVIEVICSCGRTTHVRCEYATTET
jgi:hypothetical protein